MSESNPTDRLIPHLFACNAHCTHMYNLYFKKKEQTHSISINRFHRQQQLLFACRSVGPSSLFWPHTPRSRCILPKVASRKCCSARKSNEHDNDNTSISKSTDTVPVCPTERTVTASRKKEPNQTLGMAWPAFSALLLLNSYSQVACMALWPWPAAAQ